MKKNQNDFIRVLRSALWDEELDNIQDINWKDIIKIAKEQSTLPLIADFALKQKEQILTEDESKALKEFLYGSVLTHNKINSVLFKVTDKLKAEGINPVLLKGQGVATFYREPFLRQCGDIDLYVGEEEYDRVVNSVLAAEVSEDDSESIKHYHMKIDGITVEIHRVSAVMTNEKYGRIYSEYETKYLKTQTDKVVIMGRDVTVPELTFNLLFTFYHAFHHFFSSGLGFRQICDITMFLDRNFEKIDRQRLQNMILSLDVLQPWQMFMSVAVNCLGLSPDKAPLYKEGTKYQPVLSFIFKEGNFGHYSGHHSKKNIHWFFRKIDSFTFSLTRHIRLTQISPRMSFRFFQKFLSTGLYHLFHDPK